MQSSNHTEGPWDINAFNLTQIIKVKSGPDKDGRHYKDGRHQIVIANVGQDGDDWAERRANVHLMRAAPDMQAALESALSELREWMEVFPDGSDNTPRVIEEIEAALHKSRNW